MFLSMLASAWPPGSRSLVAAVMSMPLRMRLFTCRVCASEERLDTTWDNAVMSDADLQALVLRSIEK
jgi:hypothetical protein